MVRSILDDDKPDKQPKSQSSTQNANNSDSSSNKEEVSERGLVTPQRVVKFVQFSIANQSFLSDGAPPKDNDALQESVDYEAGFEFSTLGGTLVSSLDVSQVRRKTVTSVMRLRIETRSC